VTFWVFAVAAAALAASFILTLAVKRAAGRLKLIDVPNERSSHALPTPKGGGVAIAVSSLAAMGLLTALGIMPGHLFLAIAPGGAAVAAVGLIDDIRPLSARLRLFVHFMAAAWAVVCIGPVGFFDHLGPGAPELRWLGYAISAVGIVWFLNMYNFMDGIDGIAASQAVFMCAGMAVLAVFSTGVAYTAAAAIVIGAASCGFLLWNWPPAKIFMGDVGSGYLGFALAVLGLASGAHSVFGPWSCLILAGVFAVDATFTVVRRFVRGELVIEAHRTHAFQLLAQRMGHRNVTLLVGLVNLAWVFPCALASVLWPQHAVGMTALALCPLVLCALLIGAGRPEAESAEPSAVVIPFPPPLSSNELRTPFAAQEYHSLSRHKVSSREFADRTLSDTG
jgi:Fuc2NAc and GlcNAc transferase